jgi:hypothetical protein
MPFKKASKKKITAATEKEMREARANGKTDSMMKPSEEMMKGKKKGKK